MPKSRLVIAFLIAIILFASCSAIILIENRTGKPVIPSTSVAPLNNDNLLQYEWPQFMGDSSFSRFSAGPAPDTPDLLWKANVTGIQTYLSAFGG